MTYNPNSPSTIGLEWRPTTEGKLALSARESPIPFRIPSTTVESVTSLLVPHEWAGSGSGFGRLWADIYAESDYAETDFTTVAYVPNEDIGNDGYITRSDWGTTSQIYNQISDTDDSEDPWTDYAVNTDAGSIHRCRFMFNTNTGTPFPSGKRPLYVTFEVRALGYSWSWQAPSIELSHWYNGNKIASFGSFQVPRDDTWNTYTIGPIYFDAYDQGPWNRQTILDFDTASGTKDHVGVEWRYGCKITRLTMKVTYVTDKRVAVARSAVQTVVPAGTQTTTAMTCAAVLDSTTATWSKTAQNYVAVLRRIESLSGTQFTPSVYYLDSGSTAPHNFGGVYTGAALVDAGGAVSSIGTLSTRHLGYSLSIAGASSVDTQPYYDLDAKPIGVTTYASQGIGSGDGASTYKRLRTLAGVITTPTEPLLFGVRKSSTTTASETWTGANGAAWPAQWTQGSGSTGAAATIQGNAGQMTTGTDASGYYRHYLNVSLAANFLATVKVTFSGVAAANSARVFFRGGTTFTNGVLNSGYELRLTANTNTVAVYATNGSGSQTLVGSTSFTFAGSTQYTVKVVALKDGYIGVKVWATSGTEPDTLTLCYRDTTYTGNRMALGVLGGADGVSDTITFDDLNVYDYAAVGDLSVADLSDSTIVTSMGSVTLTPGAMTVYDATVTLDASAVLAAVDYTCDIGSVNAAGAWHVLWLAGASYGLTGDQTFGAATDQAAPGGGVATTAADFIITVGSVPTAPAGFTASVQTQALPDAGDISCSVPDMTYALLSWTATALGAGFTRYEIERTEDGGSTYELVAYITTEATATWSDYQAPRNTAVSYRLRVVRSDGAVSDWSTAGPVTCTMTGQAILFTSNDDPTMNAGFLLLDENVAYTFPGADDLVLIRRYGVDNQSAFRPIERRGVMFTTRVLIYSKGMSTDPQGSPPNGEGVRAFQTLLDIAETQSTVAVLTPDGERIYAALKVPSGERVGSASFYAASVTIISAGSGSASVAVL